MILENASFSFTCEQKKKYYDTIKTNFVPRGRDPFGQQKDRGL